MGRKVAQLAGFIDQAGLFRTLGPVTNKLHFSSLPWGFCLLGSFLGTLHGTVRAEIQLPTACCIAGLLILRSGRRPRLEGWAASGLMVRDARRGAPHREGVARVTSAL